MNRFTTVNGVLSGGAIVRSTQGKDIAYDAAGERVLATSTNGSSTHIESYSYSQDGNLTAVNTNDGASGWLLAATYSRDALGNVLSLNEYNATGGAIAYSQTNTFNTNSQLTSQSTSTLQSSGATMVAWSNYSYNAYNSTTHDYTGAYQGGQVTDTYSSGTLYGTNGSITPEPYTDLHTAYTWWDSAQQSTIGYTPDTSQSTQYNTTFSYSASGHLEWANVQDYIPYTTSYAVNAQGQVLHRSAAQNSNGSQGPQAWFSYLAGKEIGETSNNGAPTNQIDFRTGVALEQQAPNYNNLWANGTGSVAYANFSQSYDPGEFGESENWSTGYLLPQRSNA